MLPTTQTFRRSNSFSNFHSNSQLHEAQQVYDIEAPPPNIPRSTSTGNMASGSASLIHINAANASAHARFRMQFPFVEEARIHARYPGRSANSAAVTDAWGAAPAAVRRAPARSILSRFRTAWASLHIPRPRLPARRPPRRDFTGRSLELGLSFQCYWYFIKCIWTPGIIFLMIFGFHNPFAKKKHH
jgi:hypothetical protein